MKKILFMLHKSGNLFSVTLILILTSAILLGSAVIENFANSIAADALSQKWRGSYDILVMAKGGKSRLSPGRDLNGLQLLDPNYGNVSVPPIESEKIQEIQNFSEVETVAPMGFLGAISDVNNWVIFTMPVSKINPGETKRYILKMRLISNDGLSDRIDKESLSVITINAKNITGKSGRSAESGIYATRVVVDNAKYAELVKQLVDDPGDFDQGNISDQMEIVRDGDKLVLPLELVPQTATTVFAVDPVAERAILGAKGKFLNPLIAADAVIARKLDVAEYLALAEDKSQSKPERIGDVRKLEDIRESSGIDSPPSLTAVFGSHSALFPYLRNTEAFPDGRIELGVRAVGDDFTVSTKTDDILRPFGGRPIQIFWPGLTGSSEKVALVDSYKNNGVSPLQFGARSVRDKSVAFELIPQKIYATTKRDGVDPDGREFGDFVAYRSPYKPAALQDMQIGLLKQNIDAFAPLEVGTYSPKNVFVNSGKQFNEEFDPLGAYFPVQTITQEGNVIAPVRNSLGIAAQSGSAIISLQQAKKLTGTDNVVTTLRVKLKDSVLGIEPKAGSAHHLNISDAQLALDRVSQKIRALGLDAEIVTGSSLQKVKLHVPKYAFGTIDSSQKQKLSELGWVEASFLTLGVAQWAENTTAAVASWVSFILLALALVSFSVVIVIERSNRMRTQYLLREQGFSAFERLAWSLGEVKYGILALIVSTIVSVVVASSQLKIWFGLCGLVLLVALVASLPSPRSYILSRSFAGTRRLLFLSTVEMVALSLAALLLGVISQLVAWYAFAGAFSSLSRATFAAVLPAGIILLIFLGFTLYLQSYAGSSYMSLARKRINLYYWDLNMPKAQIIRKYFCLQLLTLASALLVLIAAYYLLRPYIEYGHIFIYLSILWIFCWLLARTGILINVFRKLRLNN